MPSTQYHCGTRQPHHFGHENSLRNAVYFPWQRSRDSFIVAAIVKREVPACSTSHFEMRARRRSDRIGGRQPGSTQRQEKYIHFLRDSLRPLGYDGSWCSPCSSSKAGSSAPQISASSGPGLPRILAGTAPGSPVNCARFGVGATRPDASKTWPLGRCFSNWKLAAKLVCRPGAPLRSTAHAIAPSPQSRTIRASSMANWLPVRHG